MTTATPHLTCRNAAEAIDFYGRAFGATSLHVMNGPDGKILHSTIDIDGANVYVVDEFPEYGGKSPQMLGGSPVTIHLQVEDADAVFNRATEAGCTVAMPLELQFWGDRYGLLVDPYGHNWSVGQTVEERTPEQIQAAMQTIAESEGVGAMS